MSSSGWYRVLVWRQQVDLNDGCPVAANADQVVEAVCAEEAVSHVLGARGWQQAGTAFVFDLVSLDQVAWLIDCVRVSAAMFTWRKWVSEGGQGVWQKSMLLGASRG
jgi:hypothetical protein